MPIVPCGDPGQPPEYIPHPGRRNYVLRLTKTAVMLTGLSCLIKQDDAMLSGVRSCADVKAAVKSVAEAKQSIYIYIISNMRWLEQRRVLVHPQNTLPLFAILSLSNGFCGRRDCRSVAMTSLHRSHRPSSLRPLSLPLTWRKAMAPDCSRFRKMSVMRSSCMLPFRRP